VVRALDPHVLEIKVRAPTRRARDVDGRPGGERVVDDGVRNLRLTPCLDLGLCASRAGRHLRGPPVDVVQHVRLATTQPVRVSDCTMRVDRELVRVALRAVAGRVRSEFAVVVDVRHHPPLAIKYL